MRKGWTETTLGDASEFVSRRLNPSDIQHESPYVGLEHIDPRSPSITRWGAVNEISSSVTPFEPEDSLFGRLRPYLHKVAFAQFPGVCSPEILVLRTKISCETKFLYLLCSTETTIKACVEMSAGTRMPRTSTTDLASVQILLPPLVEQKRIVDVVSSVDAYIDALQQQADTARTARNAVLHELLSAGVNYWKETMLGNATDTRLGKMLSATTDDGSGEIHPYLRNANVQWGSIDLSDLKEMRFSEKERETFTLLAGDLLICEGGEPGRAALLKNDLSGIYFQKAIHRVRCKQGLRPKFLAYWMHHLTVSEQLEDFLTSTTIQHLTGEKLRQLPILLPPLDEQRRIVEIVSSMDDVIQSTEQAVTNAKNLRSGLLSDLLSGEHEIPESYDKFLEAA